MQTKQSSSSFQLYHKIVFLGKEGINKSIIIQKLLGSASKSEHESLGIEYHNLELEYQNKVHYLQLWDLSSHLERDFSLFLRNTSLIVFIFDFKDKESQKFIQNLYEKVTEFLSSVKLLFVGIADKEEKSKASKDFANWTKEKEFFLHQVNPQKNEGISQLLTMIVKQLGHEEK